jgi:hypothetical protein
MCEFPGCVCGVGQSVWLGAHGDPNPRLSDGHDEEKGRSGAKV